MRLKQKDFFLKNVIFDKNIQVSITFVYENVTFFFKREKQSTDQPSWLSWPINFGSGCGGVQTPVTQNEKQKSEMMGNFHQKMKDFEEFKLTKMSPVKNGPKMLTICSSEPSSSWAGLWHLVKKTETTTFRSIQYKAHMELTKETLFLASRDPSRAHEQTV